MGYNKGYGYTEKTYKNIFNFARIYIYNDYFLFMFDDQNAVCGREVFRI